MTGATYPDPLPHLRARRATGTALRRLTATCGERAAAAIAAGVADASVHEARLCLKRARALLRLAEWLGVHGAIGIRRRLGIRARALGALRDDAVARRAAVQAGIALRRARMARPGRRSWAHWVSAVGGEIRLIDHLRWPDPTWHELDRALEHGVRRICRRARRVRLSDLAAVHAWRKAVIVLREQLTAIDRSLPASGRAARRSVVKLAHDLGQALDQQVMLAAAREGEALPKRTTRRIRREQRRCLKGAWSRWPKLRRRLHRAF